MKNWDQAHSVTMFQVCQNLVRSVNCGSEEFDGKMILMDGILDHLTPSIVNILRSWDE